MHPPIHKRILLPLVVTITLILAARSFNADPTAGLDATTDEQWVYLSDIPWDDASTGWLGVANQQVPALNRAFHGGDMVMDGVAYDKGIGTYPLSEITYSLDDAYTRFSSLIGLDAEAHPDTTVRFMVFVDGILRYQSNFMLPGDAPRQVDVDVSDARSLRLVADAPLDQAKGAFADWAEARLLKAADPAPSSLTPTTATMPRPRATGSPQPNQRQRNEEVLHARASAMIAALPVSLRSPASSERPAGLFDRRSSKAWLSTGRVAIGVGLSPATYGTITVLNLETEHLVVTNASGSVTMDKTYVFNLDLQRFGQSPLEFNAVDDPVAGPGNQIVLHSQTINKLWQIDLRISLFANNIIMYDIAVEGDVASVPSPTFQHFSYAAGAETLLAEGDVEYVSDFSSLHYGHLYDDSIVRREPIGEGKPLFIYSARRQGGLLLTLLDHTSGPTYFQAQVKPNQAQARWGLTSAPSVDGTTSSSMRSARLYMEVTPSADIRYAFGKLRSVLDTLAPAAPLPDWFKYQWLSWYVYGMGNDAEAVQRQSDYIAANLADLGTWNLLIDAGWYVSEGKPGSDWRTIDVSKFPEGIRPLVDRLHEQGNRVVLYLSVPYIDSIVADGHWLGMRTIIEEHPDWLRLLGSDSSHQSYTFDFTNPEVIQFWSDVMTDFYVRYDVDGIKIDGVGNAEGAILSPDKVDEFGLIDNLNEQTMEIYKLFYEQSTLHRADAYVETGWLTPIFARPYVHTFRYGDEALYFSSPYPFPGLVEHIDYAIIQKEILGLRPNMGAIFDNPNGSTLNRWWLQAGLALGAHVTLSFDLAGMEPETLSTYRSLLVQYEPFSGVTTYGRGLHPPTFATTRGGTTFLGVLNRAQGQRLIAVPLSDHGIDLSRPATAYDVETNNFLRLATPFTLTIAAETFRLFVVRQDPGMMWTNSSYVVEQGEQKMTVTLRGPDGLPGYAHLLVPQPQRVLIDGKDASALSYDDKTEILSITYDNSSEGHVLAIEY